MKIAVSACLVGQNCKYNGGNNDSAPLARWLEGQEVLPVCPEILVFPAPRPKVERRGDRVIDENGKDVTDLCRAGVEQCVARLQKEGVELAVLQSRSPTCGVRQIYDGTFTGRLIPGMGLFAEALTKAGIAVLDVEEI